MSPPQVHIPPRACGMDHLVARSCLELAEAGSALRPILLVELLEKLARAVTRRSRRMVEQICRVRTRRYTQAAWVLDGLAQVQKRYGSWVHFPLAKFRQLFAN